MDEQSQKISAKEQYDLKKAEKEKGKTQGKPNKKLAQMLIGVILVLLIGTGGFLLISNRKPSTPAAPDFSKQIPYEGATHVAEGTKVNYKSNPPTSGNHWPVPLKDGIYEKEKPDEAIVHSLEHGRIWVSYKPSISDSVKEKLKNLLKGELLVIVTPRTANEYDIALSAWTRLDAFNLENGTLNANATKRIKDFISRYRNKAPENVPGNAGASEYNNY